MSVNYDPKTVEGFGKEWSRFDQSALSDSELGEQFNCYFRVFPWNELTNRSVGFDMGCGSGRWAKLMARRVGKLYCIDASRTALDVARRNLAAMENVEFVHGSFEDLPFADDSQDFGYSLGVLHHIPDTPAGIKACVRKLKPTAPFLVYIYYAFDNRSVWFRFLWRISDIGRRSISKLPYWFRLLTSQTIAFVIYFPLARISLLLESLGTNVDSFPLSAYRRKSFYTMRTDSLDRFGTRLEKRFTASQIKEMMEEAGLERVRFSTDAPYWCAVGVKKEQSANSG